jgi:hypothetical protein
MSGEVKVIQEFCHSCFIRPYFAFQIIKMQSNVRRLQVSVNATLQLQGMLGTEQLIDYYFSLFLWDDFSCVNESF